MNDFNRFESHLSEWAHQYFSPSHGIPNDLSQSILYTLLEKGKRIRPRIVFAVSNAVGLDPRAALRLAIALEIIHCFTLIHDDLPIMDNDDFRRGKPSNHRVFGSATSLLAGDAMVPLAIEAMLEARHDVRDPYFWEGVSFFLERIGAKGVVGGQVRELVSENPGLDVIEKIYLEKTGALFEVAFLGPALWTQTRDSIEGSVLRDYAKVFGVAFQLADDVEDFDQDQSGNSKSRSLLSVKPGVRLEIKAALADAFTRVEAKFGQKSAALKLIHDETFVRL